ncbi:MULTISPECIES: hypothetical protein [Kocuria]|uniref:hypothetical protein n=1 Tax=Kocuria TaxID=57493 RepID=UPI0021A72FAD|nr:MULTISPECIES: hypothetical protein [Kocuria]MCT1545109.1 hypothetical protein [Kocuria rhizophila]MCT2171691.1 hypothetical protein [Kocuria rhizophila]MDN3463142.1 hypothetical protein [Kocuria sp. APC 4018]
MNQIEKFLPGIISLLCVVVALLLQFVWHESTWALMMGLLGLTIGQIPAPGTAARKRAAQEAARNREERRVRDQRRRLLADVQAYRHTVAEGEATDARH